MEKLKKNTIKAVVFDFDGTLVDTEKLYNACWINACNYYGFNLKYENALNLRSLDSTLARNYLNELFGDLCDYDKIRYKRKQLMQKMITDFGISAKIGIFDLLTALKKKNIKTAICSASDSETIIRTLELASIENNFDTIISAKSVSKGKPYPDVYIYLCQKLNLLPEEVIVVEDAPNGIQSAFEAGCNVVMIPDLTEPDNSILEKVKFIFNDLVDFANWINERI